MPVNGPLPSNPNEIEDMRMYYVAEVALILKINHRTVLHWISGGIIAAERVGNLWRIPGLELKRFILKTQRKSDGLEYRAFKYPWLGYMMHLLIEYKNDHSKVCEAAARYRLLAPSAKDLETLWSSLKRSAPAAIRQRMEAPKGKMPTMESEDFRSWVSTLGISGLYQHAYFPCLDLLEDNSEIRLCAEVLFCGRVPYSEIVEILCRKYSFRITEEALQFFGTYFFNTLPYSMEDTETYLSRLTGNESFLKRQAWGNPEQAKVAMDLPAEADFLGSAHKIAIMAGKNAENYMGRGAAGLEMAAKSWDMWTKAHDHILKEEKAKAERESQAKAEAAKVAEGAGASGFETHPDEPKDFEDLEQKPLGEMGEEDAEADERQAEAS